MVTSRANKQQQPLRHTLLQKECHCRSPTSASIIKKKMMRMATTPAAPTKHAIATDSTCLCNRRKLSKKMPLSINNKRMDNDEKRWRGWGQQRNSLNENASTVLETGDEHHCRWIITGINQKRTAIVE
jgi:hypothetical protein